MNTAGGRAPAVLRRLAALYGVQTSYRDTQDRRVEARPESLLAALRGLGAPVEGMAGVAAALRQRAEETWCWHVEPVQVAWDGALEAIDLRLPVDGAAGAVEVEVGFEAGGAETRRLDLSAASVSHRTNLRGREFVALRLPLGLRLEDGYHTLRLRAGQREIECLVIAAPARAYAAPGGGAWGFFLPLYALHSRRSWGIGDFSDLAALVEWAAEQGADYVGTLPLLASFLDGDPYAPSPYEPVSRLFWNEIFIDIDAAVTSAAGRAAKVDTVPVATAKAARRLNARETVPYREVMALKRRALMALTRRNDQGPAANEAMRSSAAWPAPQDYAAFRAAVETLGPRWREWPSPQRDGSLSRSDYYAATARYYASAQALAEAQMDRLRHLTRMRGVRLYLDLPVGVHPDGYDAWRYQHLFVEGMSVGAPPDALAPEGQNWGFQPPNPEMQRRHGYEYTRAYLRRHLEAAGLLRIDHAIGLHRLFCIPWGGTGADGVFLKQPSEELYAMLSLESHRAQSVVVGEDLGLVPPEVRQGMARHGIGEMYVQTFAMTGDARKPFRAPKASSIASFGTHDLAPFAAFWTDDDLALRRGIGVMSDASAEEMKTSRQAGKHALWQHLRQRGLIGEGASTAEVYRGTARLLAESRARWVTLSLEDAWGETRPQNVPGTAESQHPNWLHRARYSLEQFGSLHDIITLAAMMRRVRGRKKEGRYGGRD